MKSNPKSLYIAGGVIAAVLIVVIVLVLALGGGSGKTYEKHYEAAEAAFLQKDYDKALSELDKALDCKPTAEAYLLKAQIYAVRGDTDTAMQVLYLGYSRTGSEAISRMLEELKGETPATPVPAQPTAVTVGGVTIAADATSAVLSDRDLTDADLQPLGTLTALEELTLSGNGISDLSPLRGLTRLTSLQLSDNRISDLAPLSGLTRLKTLYLDGNPVTDFTPLEGLTALRTLSMKNITVTDTQLAALQKALPNCRIYCDTPVEDVPEITLGGRSFRADVTELNLGGRDIDDISALAQCTKLKKLDLRDNKVTDLTPLESCPELEWLCLWNNQVGDLTPLLALKNLRYLDVDTNDLQLLDAVQSCTGLEELWLSNNPIVTVSGIEKLTELKRLGLKNVGLEDADLDLLMGLTRLTELTIEENEGLTQKKVDELQAALPECTIAHSKLAETPEEPEEPAEPEPQLARPDAAYVSIGANAAVNAAGTGTGYAILWDATDSAAAGIREGFLAQAKSLGMNVVADLWFTDAEKMLPSHAYGLRELGADVVIFAAGDSALSVLLRETKALSYAPQIVQVY